MTNLGPNRKRLAKFVRKFGDPDERANAWRLLGSAMKEAGINWSDVGNWIEQSEKLDEGKYTEDELQQFGQAQRAEGVEAGIKIGEARKSNGGGSGTGLGTLPSLMLMAEFCQQQSGQLKDDEQRRFISEMHASARRGLTPKRGPLGYLVSLYIKHGGRI
jgi:hypothetical protein